jgi:hypothetical protein
MIAVGSAHAMKAANGNDSTKPATPHQKPLRCATPSTDAPSAAVSETKHKHLNEALAAPPHDRQKTSSEAMKATAQGNMDKRNPIRPDVMFVSTPLALASRGRGNDCRRRDLNPHDREVTGF